MILRRLFGKRPKTPSDEARCEPCDDPTAYGEELALRMLQGDWQCACCGEWHHGLMDLAAAAPDPWPHPRDYAPNAALRLDADFLSEDFCVLAGPQQTNYLVRAVMEFPVLGLEERWGFGCWSTLSRENFENYVDGFDTGNYKDNGPWFGWLCNMLKPHYTGPDPLAVAVCPQSDRQRPKLLVREDDHPLAVLQDKGIAPTELIGIMQAYGHGPLLH